MSESSQLNEKKDLLTNKRDKQIYSTVDTQRRFRIKSPEAKNVHSSNNIEYNYCDENAKKKFNINNDRDSLSHKPHNHVWEDPLLSLLK